MGESVAEATVTSWLVNEGDRVELEDAVLEIATDKVDSEVPACASGILQKQLFQAGDVVKVGQAVAIIMTDSAESEQKVLDEELIEEAVEELPEENLATADDLLAPLSGAADVKKEHWSPDMKYGSKFHSPLVKSIIKKEGILDREIDEIRGTGKNNRITKSDLLNYLTSRGEKQVPAADENTLNSNISYVEPLKEKTPAKSISGEDDIIAMDRMRKLIADNMLESKRISAHVTSMVEVDVTNLVMWRNKVKDEFYKKEGYKITFTPLFIEAVAKALRDFPMINISIDEDKIILKKDINVGIAVALPNGNLIVPVVKNADQLNLIGLAKATNQLAVKARENKLDFEDVAGGTFTLTNIGTFGNAIGTPIINQPEVAIMSTGLIQKKPAVIETTQGDTIGIRHMMFLSMSYDHRVVDGMLGGSFLRKVGDYMETFDINRLLG